MNRPTKQTYHSDLVFQGLFYFPMMLSYLIGIIFEPGMLILGLFLQFFVGVIQVLSGLFHSIRYQDKAHQNYLKIAISYIAFSFLGGMGFGNMYFGGGEVLIGLFLFLIPVGIATWYYRLTWQAYKKVDAIIDEEYTNQSFQEDILDDVML
jgi:hypothetical protein